MPIDLVVRSLRLAPIREPPPGIDLVSDRCPLADTPDFRDGGFVDVQTFGEALLAQGENAPENA